MKPTPLGVALKSSCFSILRSPPARSRHRRIYAGSSKAEEVQTALPSGDDNVFGSVRDRSRYASGTADDTTEEQVVWSASIITMALSSHAQHGKSPRSE